MIDAIKLFLRDAREAFAEFPIFVGLLVKWSAIVVLFLLATYGVTHGVFSVVDWDSWSAVEPINRAGVSLAVVVSLSALVLAAITAAGYRKQ